MHPNRGESDLDFQLDVLLSERIATAKARERQAFDRIAGPPADHLVLFGAGGMGRRTLAGLLRIGIRPIAFADNNPNTHGNAIEGIPVISPIEAASRYGHDGAFVITIWSTFAKDTMGQRMTQLKKLGCQRVVPAGVLFWKYPEVFLPYFPMDLPHKVLEDASSVRHAFKLFADESSRREFIAQLRFRLLMDLDGLGAPAGANHYFDTRLFDLDTREVFVDCGAFDGDTIAAFIEVRGKNFRRLIAFEPDLVNVRKLEQRLTQMPAATRDKITVLPYALGSELGRILFPCTGSDQSRAGQGDTEVTMVTLDKSLEGEEPTFIKFDIEGAEIEALRGARRVIERNRPVLAVSAYHEQSHLWKIPLLLDELCSEYAFYLRPHGAEGWDLLCYAIPKERCLQNC